MEILEKILACYHFRSNKLIEKSSSLMEDTPKRVTVVKDKFNKSFQSVVVN